MSSSCFLRRNNAFNLRGPEGLEQIGRFGLKLLGDLSSWNVCQKKTNKRGYGHYISLSFAMFLFDSIKVSALNPFLDHCRFPP
ncbi:hypothetical protein BV326_05685 [Pseudomonas syringae pv. actinidiae]|nr:hypothetical protein BV326_05685 [Pseudomonas syringae pv. actinidiae]